MRDEGAELAGPNRRQVGERAELHGGMLQRHAQPPAGDGTVAREPPDQPRQLRGPTVPCVGAPRHDAPSAHLRVQRCHPHTEQQARTAAEPLHSLSRRITARRPTVGTNVIVTRAVSGEPRVPPSTTPSNSLGANAAARTKSA